MNINEFVWVKLTESGHAILKDNYRLLRMPKEYPYEPPVETNGWSRFQLWVLMNQFGAHVGNGADLPFGTEVRLTDPRSDIATELRGKPVP